MTDSGASPSPFNRKVGRRRVTQGLAAAAGLAAVGAPVAAPRAEARTLKVGVLLPRSGLLAQAGQACQRGAQLAPALLAERAVPVEVVSVDTESNADVARTQAERLIDDGAHVLVGAFESAQTLAAAQVCEQRGVPLVINIAAAPQITEQGFRFTFRNFPKSATLVTNGLTLLKALFQATGTTPRKAVFIHANDTFGQANRAAIDRLFPTLDMPFELVERIAYDPRAQDLAVEVTRARATGAELVLVTTRAGDAIKLVREMVRQRYEPLGIVSPGSPGMYDQEFYQSLGPYSEYCISNVPWINPRSPLTEAFERQFRRQFPDDRFEPYAFNAGFTFEALLIAADAFGRAGTTDGATLAEAIRRTDLAEHLMIGGPIRFDEQGQNNGIGSAAVQNRNLTPTVVLPAEVAVLPPVFPMPGWRQRG